MNLYDLILIAVIAAVFLLALRKTVSNYKKGGCSCGGSGKSASCGNCRGCSGGTCSACKTAGKAAGQTEKKATEKVAEDNNKEK